MLDLWMRGVLEEETAVAKKSARGHAAALDDGPTRVDAVASTTSVGSPIEALERDEILRTRRFGLMVVALALVGTAAATLVPGGDPLGETIMYAACAVAIVTMSFLIYQTLDPVRFR